MPSALVLGARNLGGAIADRLLVEGWKVAVVARRPETLDRARERGALAIADQALIADAVLYLGGQEPRAASHELPLTPAGDRWVP